MHQHKESLIKLSIEKSEEALISAENNIKTKNLLTAQNRAYYAVFYIVLALAYLEEYTTGKHHQLRGWFNKKFIYENKIFDKTLSKIYSRLTVNREKFDYDVTKFLVMEDTIKDLEDAKVFVSTLKEYIMKKLKE